MRLPEERAHFFRKVYCFRDEARFWFSAPSFLSKENFAHVFGRRQAPPLQMQRNGLIYAEPLPKIQFRISVVQKACCEKCLSCPTTQRETNGRCLPTADMFSCAERMLGRRQAPPLQMQRKYLIYAEPLPKNNSEFRIPNSSFFSCAVIPTFPISRFFQRRAGWNVTFPIRWVRSQLRRVCRAGR